LSVKFFLTIKSCQKSMRLSDYFLTVGLVYYFLEVVFELPKSPNQSPSKPVDFFSYFFSCFFFGYLSSRLKSLKKLIINRISTRS
jgi:hypothetical protein